MAVFYNNFAFPSLQESDLAVGPLTVTESRATVVDFTEHFMAFRSTAVLKRPSSGAYPQQIETAEDLFHSDLAYGTIKGGITERLMRTSTNGVHRMMYNQMLVSWPGAFVMSIEEGIEKSRREQYSFILDAPMAEYKMGHEPCDLYSIEPFLERRLYALAIRKGDRLKEVIDQEIRHMRRNQILQSLYLKWWASSCNSAAYNSGMRDSENKGVSPATSPRTPPSAGYRSGSPGQHHGLGHGSHATLHLGLALYVTLALVGYRLVCSRYSCD